MEKDYLNGGTFEELQAYVNGFFKKYLTIKKRDNVIMCARQLYCCCFRVFFIAPTLFYMILYKTV